MVTHPTFFFLHVFIVLKYEVERRVERKGVVGNLGDVYVDPPDADYVPSRNHSYHSHTLPDTYRWNLILGVCLSDLNIKFSDLLLSDD